ncbi:MAG: hypothetical protein Q9165_006005 [Trypethelium subeluteriae]
MASADPITVDEALAAIPDANPCRAWNDERWSKDMQNIVLGHTVPKDKPWRFNEEDTRTYLDCSVAAYIGFRTLISNAFKRANPSIDHWKKMNHAEKRKQSKRFSNPILVAWSTQFNIPPETTQPSKPNERLQAIAYERYKIAGEKKSSSSKRELDSDSTTRPPKKPKKAPKPKVQPSKSSRKTASSPELSKQEKISQRLLQEVLAYNKLPTPLPEEKAAFKIFFLSDDADLDYEVLKDQSALEPPRVFAKSNTPANQVMDVLDLEYLTAYLRGKYSSYDPTVYSVYIIGHSFDPSSESVAEISSSTNFQIWTRTHHAYGRYPVVLIACRPDTLKVSKSYT